MKKRNPKEKSLAKVPLAIPIVYHFPFFFCQSRQRLLKSCAQDPPQTLSPSVLKYMQKVDVSPLFTAMTFPRWTQCSPLKKSVFIGLLGYAIFWQKNPVRVLNYSITVFLHHSTLFHYSCKSCNSCSQVMSYLSQICW